MLIALISFLVISLFALTVVKVQEHNANTTTPDTASNIPAEKWHWSHQYDVLGQSLPSIPPLNSDGMESTNKSSS